jgi:hypothetical protein
MALSLPPSCRIRFTSQLVRGRHAGHPYLLIKSRAVVTGGAQMQRSIGGAGKTLLVPAVLLGLCGFCFLQQGSSFLQGPRANLQTGINRTCKMTTMFDHFAGGAKRNGSEGMGAI